MVYVITCGDEGVQVNVGTRLSMVGAGVGIEGFTEVVKSLKQLFGESISIAASAENDWVKQHLSLDTYEQADATMQQQVEALADKEKLQYAGIIPFSDPRELKTGVKAHMVRPKGVHFANKVCFTLSGGEQTYSLGNYLISAEWITMVDEKLAKQLIDSQVEFYTKLAGQPLKVVFEERGVLTPEQVAASKALLEKWGYKAE